MKASYKWLLGGAAALPLAWHVAIGEQPAEAAQDGAVATQATPVQVAYHPDREAYFGDIHLHTTNSFDAYALMGTKTTPEEAYRFARGETIDYLGQPIRRSEPLDFLAVTDHSENIGVFNQLDDPNSAFSLSELGKLARAGGYENFIKIVQVLNGNRLGGENEKVAASAWARNVKAANDYNQPGKFTAFVGYEWTSMPSGQNLHRNVIFKGDKAPAPFTSQDSTDPQDLWSWLSKIRIQGYEALAIPHNANASNGLMYDWTTLKGRPIDEAYAELRAINEPLVEVAQNKGTSETHPALSGNDEFAGYEIFDKLLLGGTPSKPDGSYWRDALGKGLVLQSRIGVNPFKDGAAGGSDLHSGLSVSSAQEYGGVANANLGGGKLTKEQTREALGRDAFDRAVDKPQPGHAQPGRSDRGMGRVEHPRSRSMPRCAARRPTRPRAARSGCASSAGGTSARISSPRPTGSTRRTGRACRWAATCRRPWPERPRLSPSRRSRIPTRAISTGCR